MSNCKFETSNGRCGLKGSYAYRHKCFTEDLCKCHEPKTNADRIRAMTDEELRDFLQSKVWICETHKLCDVCPMYDEEKGCLSTLEWLKQPAE